jgi:hypothetical protein
VALKKKIAIYLEDMYINCKRCAMLGMTLSQDVIQLVNFQVRKNQSPETGIIIIIY